MTHTLGKLDALPLMTMDVGSGYKSTSMCEEGLGVLYEPA
jgi:hypothetical protein